MISASRPVGPYNSRIPEFGSLSRNSFIKQRVARLAAGFGSAGLPQAIDDPLRDPAANPQAVRDVPRVKRVWQFGRQQRKQVARRLKLMNADDGEQPLIFDDEIVASPT